MQRVLNGASAQFLFHIVPVVHKHAKVVTTLKRRVSVAKVAPKSNHEPRTAATTTIICPTARSQSTEVIPICHAVSTKASPLDPFNGRPHQRRDQVPVRRLVHAVLGVDAYKLAGGVRFRKGMSFLAQALDVEPDRLANQRFDFGAGLSHGHAAWQVRNISTVARWTAFDYNQVFHRCPSIYFLSPASLSTLLSVPGRHFQARLARDGYSARFGRVMKLPVAAFLANLKPAVRLQTSEQLVDLDRHELSGSYRRSVGVAPQAIFRCPSRLLAGDRISVEDSQNERLDSMAVGAEACLT